jgi:hypothetical protein
LSGLQLSVRDIDRGYGLVRSRLQDGVLGPVRRGRYGPLTASSAADGGKYLLLLIR